MWSELKTLLWLQWKLTRAMFRSRRLSDRLRVLGLLLRVVSFAFTLPMFVLMGGGLAVGLILLSSDAAFELVMIVNVGLFFIWLLLPASANSQITERFEMSRLFPHPISFRSIVAGSTLMAMLTMTGLWTVPLLLGEIAGLTFHQPLAFPLIVVGALPAFALLVLSGRIMDDLFDLVAGDRRLRALALTLLSLPFMSCWLLQYIFQYTEFSGSPIFDKLSTVDGPIELLEMARLSRFLIWLPPAWPTAGMGLALRGQWGLALLMAILAVGFVALLLWTHAGITRRLMRGAALTVGVQRVRSRRWLLQLPGPPAFWALFRKDWLYLWRSPMPRRLIFSSVMMVVAMLFPLRGMAQESDAPQVIRDAMPVLAAGFVLTMSNMAINMGLTANYFGAMDREGFGTLALSALDRRYAIVSANLATLVYAGGHILLASLAIALLTGSWAVLPLGLCMGLCMQVGGMPAYNLAAIIGPYRTQLKFQGRQRGNAWGMLGWVVAALPALLLIGLPYVLWKPALALTLPLAAIYSLGLYAVTLKPLAQTLQRREYDIWKAIIVQD